MMKCQGFVIRWNKCPTLARLHGRDVFRFLEGYVGRNVRKASAFEVRMAREVRKLIGRPVPPWGRGLSRLEATGPRERWMIHCKPMAEAWFDVASGQLEVTVWDGVGVIEFARG